MEWFCRLSLTFIKHLNASVMVNEHRVTWTTGLLDSLFGLFYGPFFGPYFGPFFWTIFGPFYRGGGGGRPLVLRKGWNAFYQNSGRGGRQTVVTNGGVVIRTHGGVGGWCISNWYWLMKFSLDHTNYFERFFDWLFLWQKFFDGP